MSNAPAAYPLQWPVGWPRTQPRQKGAYRTSMAGALSNLRVQVKLLAGEAASRTLVLSSNCTLGQERPPDPGVVAFFTLDKQQIAIPCDRWLAVEHNIQAIALTIEAMRAMDRHGARHMMKAMFQGFAALPAPDDWRVVLGVPTCAPGTGTGHQLADAETRYRNLARSAHPDMPGGSQEQMARLNTAIDAARKEFGIG